MKNVIHTHLYDPSAPSLFKSMANDKAEFTAIHCGNSANCGLFARGECVLRTILFASACPYGHVTKEVGPTKRAKGFRSWIDKRPLYKGATRDLSSPVNKVCIVGDYIFLPYAHMNMNEGVPYLYHSKFFSSGSSFMFLKDFTLETVLSIVDFKPQAFMGGEITTYQKEVIPVFLTHMKEVMPKMYENILKARPERAGVLRTNIGRKAFLSSLRPGVVVTKYHKENNLSTQHWTWDGEFLTSEDAGMSFAIVGYDECLVRLKPKPHEVVEITSDDQVDEDTRYKD